MRSVRVEASGRRPRVRTSLVLLVIALLGILTAAAPRLSTAGPSIPDELLIGFHAGVSDSDARQVHRTYGATLLEILPHLRVHRVRVPAAAIDAVQRSLARNPRVKFVERNEVFAPHLQANDPLETQQWHLPKIAAPQAWDISTGASNVTIAILDSGVDATHPDLAPKIVPGYNTFDGNVDTHDVYGHGTLVAGSAAAIGGNGIGVASPAWQNPIMPIRVTDTSGYAYTSTLANGLTWAADHGARVMNMSFAGVAGSSTITSAAQYAMQHGAVVVAAAGNCGCLDATAPTPYIVSVSATDANDVLASWSSYGAYVDLSAPGVSITTTALGGGYASVSGTSFASPITVGVVAVMLSVNASLSPTTTIQLLTANTDDLGAAGWDQYYGAGRLDAYRAVAAALAYASPADTTPPSVSITSPATGAVVAGAIVVSASATDNVGVTQVDLFVDGAYYASTTVAPYTFALDTTTLIDGSHTLGAHARDAAGNVGVSSDDVITVQNTNQAGTGAVQAPPDTTPPVASISSVSVIGKKLSVSVSASDNVAVVRVELYFDGLLVATDTAAPYKFALNWSTTPAGAHTLQAKAYDAAGNVGVSAIRTVTK